MGCYVHLPAREHLLRRPAATSKPHVETSQSQQCHEKRCSGHTNRDQHPSQDTVAYRRLVVTGCIRGPEAHTKKNCQAKEACGHEEAHKVNVVPLSYAIVDEGAMVVKPQHTVVALSTVRCPRRSQNLACGAPAIASCIQFLRNCVYRLQCRRINLYWGCPARLGNLYRKTLDCELQRWSGYYARVCAGSQ